MNMIRHDDERVEVEFSRNTITIADGLNYQGSDLRPAKIQGTSLRVIQQTVHHEEGPSGGRRGRENSTGGKTVMQTPRDKHWVADGIVMRQTSVKSSTKEVCRLPGGFLKEIERPIANRPQVANLPHGIVNGGVSAINAVEGYRLWAASYDGADNALLALETRALSARMEDVAGYRILDAGSGTGRWMKWAQSRGARVFGVDACREMVLKAERKPGLGGRSALGDIRSIPIQDDAVDLTLCSFTMGYLPSAGPVLQELARVSRQVIVSDLHPTAARAGWTRSFRAGERVYQLHHYEHSIAELDDCARSAGLFPQWRAEASFAEPEREIFRRAGKENLFDDACRIPAVLITVWRK